MGGTVPAAAAFCLVKGPAPVRMRPRPLCAPFIPFTWKHGGRNRKQQNEQNSGGKLKPRELGAWARDPLGTLASQTEADIPTAGKETGGSLVNVGPMCLSLPWTIPAPTGRPAAFGGLALVGAPSIFLYIEFLPNKPQCVPFQMLTCEVNK